MISLLTSEGSYQSLKLKGFGFMTFVNASSQFTGFFFRCVKRQKSNFSQYLSNANNLRFYDTIDAREQDRVWFQALFIGFSNSDA